MAVKDRFFKLKLKLTDIKLKIKRAGPALCGKIRSVNSESIKHFLRGMIFGIKPLIFETLADLKNWNAKTAAGKSRYFWLLKSFFISAAIYNRICFFSSICLIQTLIFMPQKKKLINFSE